MNVITFKKCLFYTFFLGVLTVQFLAAQEIANAYPPFWWKGMENDTLEIMLYDTRGIEKGDISISGSGEIELLRTQQLANTRYAFLTLIIPDTYKGKGFKIKWNNGSMRYEIRDRKGHNPSGLNPSDVLYLITPDRFANGDPSNDRIEGMHEKVYDRNEIYGRHGGDIKGIIDHLDYINDMGFNSLWICPLLENDQPDASYHGYAITDHYLIDPRFGSLEDYGLLMEQMHSKGMKMVMDVVYNHVGSKHHLFEDLPDSSFFNFHREFTRTNYRAVSLFDPNASESDRKRFTDGWFDTHMPDVNQRQPQFANFLIQNSIWWIELFGIDAFRIDTYTYPDQKFMGDLARRIRMEYPDFFLFGETWVHGPEIQSYFVENNPHNPVSTHLNTVTDFQLCFAIQEALTRSPGWTEGITKIYYRLAADYLYEEPGQMVTFLDNHDLARVFGYLNGDFDKFRIALTMLFTMRGIPCLYYGTEILLKETENHGVIREDFPGGWPGDTLDKFTAEGRSDLENQAYELTQILLKWRSQSDAIKNGRMMQFVPEDHVYVYFRFTKSDTVMVVCNVHEKEDRELDLSRFAEVWPEGSLGYSILDQKTISGSKITLGPKSIQVIEMK